MKNLLIMDKISYRNQHDELLKIMSDCLQGDNTIIYTAYEDEIIRKVRNYKIIGSFLQHILYWKKSFKYAKEALKLKADNIYCINPIVGIFLGLFNKHSRIVLGGFLFEPKSNHIYYILRKWFTKRCLRGIDKAVVYGSKEVKYYKKIFNLDKFVFIPYGINFEKTSHYEGNLPENMVFSGGGSNRDYSTLVSAYNLIENKSFPLVIATQPWRLDGLDISSIQVINDVVVETFGDVLRRADLLVLSLRDSDISAGHMVMFQAMSIGIPVVVNDIPSIRDYVDDTQVVFFESQNIIQLKNLLENYNNNSEEYIKKAKNAQMKYEQDLTFEALLYRFLKV